MLKFLRKYNKAILVVFGVLLMVVFLLPETIQRFGQARPGSTVMRVSGERVTLQTYMERVREYESLRSLMGRGEEFFRLVAGQNADHWLLLTREAEAAGMVAHARDGQDFIPSLSRELVNVQVEPFRQQLTQSQIDTFVSNVQRGMDQSIGPVAQRAGMTEEQMYEALAKLKGVMRLRASYVKLSRFSDRRMAHGYKQFQDAAEIRYVIAPADRELPNVTAPGDEEAAAHFEKYKSAEPGSGELGIGYRLPERVKAEWLTLDRAAVRAALKPDAIELKKRFLRKHPSGQPPEGQTVEQVTAALEAELLNEQTDQVMRTADQAVRGEVDKALRRLEVVGDFRSLPDNWDDMRPSLEALAGVVVERVRELNKVTIPSPTVERRTANWLSRDDVGAIEGLGQAFLRLGAGRQQSAADVLFGVKELAGSEAAALQRSQVGVPLETLSGFDGSRFYVTVVDARKASAPDSLAEVRERVDLDLKKLAAYQRLKDQAEAYMAIASSQGLAGLDEMSTGNVAISAVLDKRDATVKRESMFPPDERLNLEEFREKVLAKASALDPLGDLEAVPGEQKTIVMPLPKQLGLAVAQITGLTPVTIENYRRGQLGAATFLQRRELEDMENDPFSLKNLEQRLRVVRERGSVTEATEAEADRSS